MIEWKKITETYQIDDTDLIDDPDIDLKEGYLDDLIRDILNSGCTETDGSGHHYYNPDDQITNYHTGEYERISIHPHFNTYKQHQMCTKIINDRINRRK